VLAIDHVEAPRGSQNESAALIESALRLLATPAECPVRPLAIILAVATVLSVPALPSAQSDLDQLMASVLTRRDDNWKKLQQFTLIEENTFRLVGPMETPIFGSRREYVWLPRQGYFVRSPLSADGVTIGETERRKEEDEFLAHEQQRENRRAARRGVTPDAAADATDPADIPNAIRQTIEPEFVSAAYFLKFRFERGHYALVGRERLLDRDVLRIEYYPERLFRDPPRGRGGQSEKDAARGAEINRQMNKVSMVTLWVEPNEQQIVQYEFQNVDADFLPARWLLRLDRLAATMRMATPFPGVWLPASVGMRVEMTLATGRVLATYDAKYRDYRKAETDSRVIIP
jgi:hypothetical protein